MKTSSRTAQTEMSLAGTIGGLARHYLGGRRGLLFLGTALAAVGLATSWGWLAAVGIAPVLVALAPCALMCALGVCMNKMGGKSCSSETPGNTPQPSNSDSAPAAAAGDFRR